MMVLWVSLGYRKLIGRPGPCCINACGPRFVGGDAISRKHPLNPVGRVRATLTRFCSVNALRLRVMTKSATGYGGALGISRPAA